MTLQHPACSILPTQCVNMLHSIIRYGIIPQVTYRWSRQMSLSLDIPPFLHFYSSCLSSPKFFHYSPADPFPCTGHWYLSQHFIRLRVHFKPFFPEFYQLRAHFRTFFLAFHQITSKFSNIFPSKITSTYLNIFPPHQLTIYRIFEAISHQNPSKKCYSYYIKCWKAIGTFWYKSTTWLYT